MIGVPTEATGDQYDIYIYIHMYILWSFIIDQSFKFEKKVPLEVYF